MDIKREKYIVVLELDIPAAGTPIEEAGTPIEDCSTQNGPDQWVWDRIIDSDKPPYHYKTKLIASYRV